jgi:hypothetical protein
VAFSVTPARSGVASLATSGSIDTVMAVFSFPFCDSIFSALACDDDGGTALNARLSLSVTAGTTYYVVIAPSGTTTPSGTSTLTVTLP